MDKKEELKRQNYFDYKRDEFMAMDEYLQSSISEIDLQKMNEGGMMTMENMTMPIGYQEGGPVPRSRQQSVMEEEAMQQAMQNKQRRAQLEQAMMDAEENRLSKIDPNDPESESMSTYGQINDADRLKVAMMIAREQGNISEENIFKILNELMSVSGMAGGGIAGL